MTEWQRNMARTLVRKFNESVPFTPDPSVSQWQRERFRFEVASAMCHLLDDIAEGRQRERFFVGINIPEPENEVKK